MTPSHLDQMSALRAEASFIRPTGRLMEVRPDVLVSVFDAIDAVLTPDQRIRLGAALAAPAPRLRGERLRRFRHPWMLQRMQVRTQDGALVEHVVIPTSEFSALVSEVIAHRGPSVGRGLKTGEPKMGPSDLIDAFPPASTSGRSWPETCEFPACADRPGCSASPFVACRNPNVRGGDAS